ncbi:MAG: hypothetical protein Q9O62_11265 [Ardenticatenia bacterium]|nr:hypothetical protein [Ardenticatenia bacterium]
MGSHTRLLGRLLLGALLALVAVGTWTRQDVLRRWLRAQTGEELLAAQVRALGHLVSGYLRPRPATEPLRPVRHADLFPFGVNTFLQNETDPRRVERTLALIEAAGFRWIRQEFPWEDLEIHRKGWFVDLRNREIRNAWIKYDYIVERAEAHELTIIARLSNPPAWARARGNEVGPQAPPDNLPGFLRLRASRGPALPGAHPLLSDLE